MDKTTWYEYIKNFDQNITEDEAYYILWEETCYPAGDVEMVKNNIKEYFKRQNK